MKRLDDEDKLGSEELECDLDDELMAENNLENVHHMDEMEEIEDYDYVDLWSDQTPPNK